MGNKPSDKAKRQIARKVAGKAKRGLGSLLRKAVFSGRCGGCNTGMPKGSDGWLCRECSRGGGGAMSWMTLAEAEAWNALTPNEQARAKRGKS